LSDTGLVRAQNEDRFAARPPLFLVADGMGGQAGGEVAAQLVVDQLLADVDRGELRDGPTIADVLQRANQEVRRRAALDPSLQGMGTTCTAVVVLDGKAHVIHVGDSRAYLLRDEKLIRLTDDHTAVDRMRREGILTAEQAETHPHRHVLSRAVGAHETVEIDQADVDLRPDDRLLLCSDGLTGMVAAPDVVRALALTSDPDTAADALVRAALAAGGYDNVTVVVVDPMHLPTTADRVVPATPQRESGAAPRSIRRSTALGVAGAIGLIGLILGAAIGIMAVRGPVAPTAPPPSSLASPAATSPAATPSAAAPSVAVPSVVPAS
jgi:protein phosphatase